MNAVPAKERCDCFGDACKHPRRGGEAERQGCELEEPSVVEKAEVLEISRVDGDMEVDILEVDGGRPGGKR